MKRLTTKHLLAARLLAEGRSQEFVANELGIAQQNISKWKAKPLFNAEVTRLIDLAREEISRNLMAGLPGAVNTLNELALKGDDKTRLRASQLVLDNYERARRWYCEHIDSIEGEVENELVAQLRDMTVMNQDLYRQLETLNRKLGNGDTNDVEHTSD